MSQYGRNEVDVASEVQRFGLVNRSGVISAAFTRVPLRRQVVGTTIDGDAYALIGRQYRTDLGSIAPHVAV